MKRYAALPWPLTGLLVALALIVQAQLLAGSAGGSGAMMQSWLQVVAMSVAAASLALLLLPPRRLAYLLGFIVCAGLMGWALWLQYAQGLEPCPLCMFQRVAVCAVGVVFLMAFLHNPLRRGAATYALLTLVFAGAGAALAGRQIWLQALPKDQVPACGMGISYMLDTLPLADVVLKTLAGSGECAEKCWVFLDLSIAGWTFVFFVSMIVAAFALVRRD